MASEATAPSSHAQNFADKEINDSVGGLLVNAVNPGDSIISVSFVAAPDLHDSDFETLKASIADHFNKHFKTPISKVNLSVNLLANDSMAPSVEHDSLISVTDSTTPLAEHDIEDEVIADVITSKANKKVPRPPNAFIIYRKEWHSTVVAENPGLHNNAISVIIGKKWKNESHEIRDEYKHKADEAKYQHKLANPGYQYQPRKPSEKKKRMTKNKIAKLAAKSTAAKSSTSPYTTASGTATDDVVAPPPVVSMLEFNGTKTKMSFRPGSGTTKQLIAEVTDFNNTHFDQAQQAAYFQSGQAMPALSSTIPKNNWVVDPVTHIPYQVEAEDLTAINSDYYDQSAEDFFDDFVEHDPPNDSTKLVDMSDIYVPAQHESLPTSEVLRHIDLSQEFKAGLNEFFDFEGFEQVG